MDFVIGDKVLLTEDSEWVDQNKRDDEEGDVYEVAGVVVGRYINKQREGKFSSSFTDFKYAVLWEDEEEGNELYYRDDDLKALVLPATNQEAKKLLSREW